MEIFIILCIAIVLSVFLAFMDDKKHNKSNKEEEPEWVGRHKEQARVYRETHKEGTKVIAENKSGVWKKGEIIGQHHWELWHFYFTVKFNDGEIYRVSENKVTKLNPTSFIGSNEINLDKP